MLSIHVANRDEPCANSAGTSSTGETSHRSSSILIDSVECKSIEGIPRRRIEHRGVVAIPAQVRPCRSGAWIRSRIPSVQIEHQTRCHNRGTRRSSRKPHSTGCPDRAQPSPRNPTRTFLEIDGHAMIKYRPLREKKQTLARSPSPQQHPRQP